MTGHCHLKGCLFKLGLVDSPGCDRCKQANETAYVLGDCETLAALRFRHLGHHLLKPGDFTDISVSKVLHFLQSWGAAECLSKWGAQMIRNEVQGLLGCLPLRILLCAAMFLHKNESHCSLRAAEMYSSFSGLA
jgi:hypothetical protein